MTADRVVRTSSRLLLVAALAAGAAACGNARRVAGDGAAGGPASCDPCHGAPPASGAHLAHVNPASAPGSYGALHVAEDVAPSGAPSYDFGCGHCHPLDLAHHVAHVARPVGGVSMPDVVLDPRPAPATSLRARNAPGAAYDPVTRTCNGVYCHSSGQDQGAIAYRPTPRWDAPSGSLGCDGCHGNPPSYPSGGAGAPDANSHLNLDLELVTTAVEPAWEWGHFASLPGPAHGTGPKHGGGDPTFVGSAARASPITCQTCHFETVDAENVRPGGFFYFDASGDYDLRPGGIPGRESSSLWQAAQCVTCHGAESTRGRVHPLRHVNGRREVAFDRRTQLPPGYATGLPALVTADPVRPYYMTVSPWFGPLALAPADCATNPVPSCDVASDVSVREVVGGGRVLTFTLEHAQYDPTTKTCSSVACHLERQRQVDAGAGAASAPLRWGAAYRQGDLVCGGCHER